MWGDAAHRKIKGIPKRCGTGSEENRDNVGRLIGNSQIQESIPVEIPDDQRGGR